MSTLSPPAPPELPRVTLDTAYPSPTASVRRVAAGGDVQAAIDASRAGDTVELESGASFVGNFTLPPHGAGWVFLRSSRSSELAPDTRVTPDLAGLMPKLLSPNQAPALKTHGPASSYRLVGLEVSITSEARQNYNLVELGTTEASQSTLAAVPSDIVVDRCYLHGRDGADVRRAIALNSARTSIVDSWIDRIHDQNADAQALAGWNGPGPFKICNCHLEAATENILFGGDDARIPDLVPSDIDLRRNHLFKPLTLRIGHPTYAGREYRIKNLLELKNARRVLIDGNTFENNWGHAQVGFSVLFTPRNQSGGNPWTQVCDVTFTRNRLRGCTSGVNILATDDLHPSLVTERIRLAGNDYGRLPDRLYQILGAVRDLDIEHETGFPAYCLFSRDGAPAERVRVRRSVYSGGSYAMTGQGAITFEDCVIVGPYREPGDQWGVPRGTVGLDTQASVPFVDYGANDFRLKATSLYARAATGVADIGADMDAIDAAIGGSVTPPVVTPWTGAVTGFCVRSLVTGAPTVIRDGVRIGSSGVPLALDCTTAPATVGSVWYDVDGAPFTGNLRALSVGPHVARATPYERSAQGGRAGTPAELRFSIVATAAPRTMEQALVALVAKIGQSPGSSSIATLRATPDYTAALATLAARPKP